MDTEVRGSESVEDGAVVAKAMVLGQQKDGNNTLSVRIRATQSRTERSGLVWFGLVSVQLLAPVQLRREQVVDGRLLVWFSWRGALRRSACHAYRSIEGMRVRRSSFFLLKKLTLRSPSIVEFATQEESKNAIATLSESQLLGRPIFIREVCPLFHPLQLSTKVGPN